MSAKSAASAAAPKPTAAAAAAPAPANDDDNDEEGSETIGFKRKRAVLFGYSGTGFKGLQSQVGGMGMEAALAAVADKQPEDGTTGDADNDDESKPDTVEDALHLALVKAGAIRACNAESFQKIGWTRSARTDRGVHAASQVIAAKLHVPGKESCSLGGDVSREQEDDMVRRVNSFLPPQIRVYRILRVANTFNARSATCSRTYGYFLPTFVLQREGASTQKLLQELRSILGEFVGTHSFHNYTENLPARDPRSSRIIHSFSVSPEIVTCAGRDMFRLTVRGQSFLKHHIRRMVGFAVECVRRGAGHGVEMTRLSLHPFQVCIPNSHMPMAPAEALFLDSSSFEQYNTTVNVKTKRQEGAAQREPIDFEKDATVFQARERLIAEIVMPAIFTPEKEEDGEAGRGAFCAFEQWIEDRAAIEFPPNFAVPDVPTAVVDAQEFLRCVERDRVKRMKLEEYRRTG